MSFREKERDRSFQLELLGIQLKHEREVGFLGAFITTGVSFIVFSLSILAAFEASKIVIPGILVIMLIAYLFVGAVLAIFSIIEFCHLKSSEREDIEKIRKKYVVW